MSANSWKQQYCSLPVNKDCNLRMVGFSLLMVLMQSVKAGSQNLTEFSKLPFLVASDEKKLCIFTAPTTSEVP
eukprot:13532712-Ditylum_brightwellii.AAC.1